MVEPSKIIFLISNTIPQKEDIILLYIGYHSIPKLNTTPMAHSSVQLESRVYHALSLLLLPQDLA